MNEFVLYSYFRSSASYRVRIALNLKDIAYAYRAIHLLNNGGEQNTEDFRKLNPSGEVPTLLHNGKALAQSMAILDYLDHVAPAPRLFPEDPYRRALVIQACEIVNSGVQPVHNLKVLQALEDRFDADQKRKNDWAAHWITKGLDSLEAFLKPHAGDFSFGHEVSAADCFLMPQLVNADRFQVSLAPYPTLSRIRANCEKLDPFKRAAPNVQPDTPPNV
jgi:maleylacetoacetate isomerase